MPESSQVAQLDQVGWVDRLEDLEQAARELRDREANGLVSLQARIDLSGQAFSLLFPALGDPAIVIASCRASVGLSQPVLVATELPEQLGSLLGVKARCWSEAKNATGPVVGDLVPPDDWPAGDEQEPEDMAEPESEAVPEARPEIAAEPVPEPVADSEPEPQPNPESQPEREPEPEHPAPDANEPEADEPAADDAELPVSAEPLEQTELLAPELAAWMGRSYSWVHAQIRAGVLAEGTHYRRRGRALLFDRDATFAALAAAGYTIPDSPRTTVEAVKSPPQPPDGWLSVADVRARLGLELAQLRNWSRCGIIPESGEVLIGRARYYDPDMITALENLRGRQ